jgi:hypothetical protein
MRVRVLAFLHEIPPAQKGYFLGNIFQKMPFLRRRYLAHFIARADFGKLRR